MTQTWDKNGTRLPVTVVQIDPHQVTQVKSADTDGYHALQIGIGTKKDKHLTKPVAGHFKKQGIQKAPKTTKEVRLENPVEAKVGDSINLDQVLTVGSRVSVTGFSIGRGFAGVVKRHNFAGGPKTHGQSDRHRAPGSIGQGTDPGRVWKGKRMAGRMGNQKFTVKNLTVVQLNADTGEVWLKGSIPGHTNSLVQITKTGDTNFAGLANQPEPTADPADSNTEPNQSTDTTQETNTTEASTDTKS